MNAETVTVLDTDSETVVCCERTLVFPWTKYLQNLLMMHQKRFQKYVAGGGVDAIVYLYPYVVSTQTLNLRTFEDYCCPYLKLRPVVVVVAGLMQLMSMVVIDSTLHLPVH